MHKERTSHAKAHFPHKHSCNMCADGGQKPRRMVGLIIMAPLCVHAPLAMKNAWNEARSSWDGRQQYWRDAGDDSRGRGSYAQQERRTSEIAEAAAAAVAAATSAANDKNKKKKQKKSKRSRQKKHRKGGKRSSSNESDTESSTSDSEESTDSSSQTSSSEDDKKKKRKSKKSDKNKKAARKRARRTRRRNRRNARSEVQEKKATGTPIKEYDDEEKKDLRAKLEAEHLRA